MHYLSPARRAICYLFLAGYAGKSHAASYLCLAAGYLGSFLCWWSVELDHRWGGDYEIVWRTLGDVGNYLRTFPPWFGLPVPDIADF